MAAKTFKKSYTSLFKQTYRVNGSAPDITDFPVSSVVTYESSRSDGGSVPGWKAKIRKGEEATTNVSGTYVSIVSRQPAKGWYTRMQKNDFNVFTGPWKVSYQGFPWPTRAVSVPVVGTIQRQTAEAEATKKFYKKLNAINQDLEGLVFLGELRETIRMLRKPAAAFFKAAERDYLQALKREKRRDPRKWVDAIAGSWLEFQFGVQPLVSDLKGAYDALDRLNWDPIIVRRIHAVGRDFEPYGAPSEHLWNTAASLAFSGRTWDTLRKKVVYRALWVRSRDKPEDLSTGKRLAESFGFELEQFVPTLYELMPWSFLIDYFTNIGDIIGQTFTSTSDVRWVVGTTIHDHEQETVSDFDIAHTRGNNTTNSRRYLSEDPNRRGASILYRRRTFTRMAVKPPTPHFMWRLPGSHFKEANIAALIAQADILYPQSSSRKTIWRRL